MKPLQGSDLTSLGDNVTIELLDLNKNSHESARHYRSTDGFTTHFHTGVSVFLFPHFSIFDLHKET